MDPPLPGERGLLRAVGLTEGRLSVKLDPTKCLLNDFIALNSRVLGRFAPAGRAKINVHACPGGDRDSTHSADVDYGELLPRLFGGSFYVQLASERDRGRVLGIIRGRAWPDQRIFVGLTDPIDPRVETPEEARARVLEAAEYIAPDRLGTTDDCGFSPFADDTSTAREIAFEKIRARDGDEARGPPARPARHLTAAQPLHREACVGRTAPGARRNVCRPPQPTP